MAAEAIPFSDLPEDVQLRILSFLSPSEISTFASTSKRFGSICLDDSKLWHAMCDRRWGSKTEICKWGNGKISYKLLYKTLNEWENLIGFWRPCGQTNTGTVNSPSLVFFDWESSFLSGSRVCPLKDGSYGVSKSPFIYMGLSPDGRIFSFINLDENFGFVRAFEELGLSECDHIPVNVNFMEKDHFLVEENRWFTYNLQEDTKNSRSSSSGDESEEVVTGRSPKECVVTEMYTQLANRTSPGGDRRRRRRKVKERQGNTKWEPEHFVKIIDYCATPSKPLQGLWKGFGDGTELEFYLVKYDEVGGVTCRKVGNLSRYTAPVFWTSSPAFIEPPFASDEVRVFNGRIQLGPLSAVETTVSRMMYINSNYDLVLPGLVGNGGGSVEGEGRIWVYESGNLGFGFLRDRFIVDLKPVVEDGCLVDAVTKG